MHKENITNCPHCERHCPAESVSCMKGMVYFAEQESDVEEMEPGEHNKHEGPVSLEKHAEHEARCRCGERMEQEQHMGHGERKEHGKHMGHGDHMGCRKHMGCREQMGHSEHWKHGGQRRPCEPERGHIAHGHHRMCALAEMEERDDLQSLISRCGHILHHQPGQQRGQGKILKILAQMKEMTQKELQDFLQIRPGSMSELVSKLEDKGLLERVKDEYDKRKIVLRITEAGKVTEEQNSSVAEEQELFQVLSEEEQNTLKELLKKLLDDWKPDCGR